MIFCEKNGGKIAPVVDVIPLILHEAMPMKIYKVVQTGANTRLGGVKVGNGIFLYQVFVDLITIGAPTIPPSRELATQATAAIDALSDVEEDATAQL